MLRFLPHLFLLVGCTAEQQGEVYEDTAKKRMRFEFGAAESNTDWFVVNDDVMGGVSEGEMALTDTSILFEGEVSTDNNGGFVSLRSPTADYDLSDYTEVVVSYRAEGHHFSMVLADTSAWWLPNFKYEVISPSSDWTTATVSLYDFKEVEMAGSGERETGVTMTEDHLSDVIRLELINSEFESGAFLLEIDYVEFQGPLD